MKISPISQYNINSQNIQLKNNQMEKTNLLRTPISDTVSFSGRIMDFSWLPSEAKTVAEALSSKLSIPISPGTELKMPVRSIVEEFGNKFASIVNLKNDNGGRILVGADYFDKFVNVYDNNNNFLAQLKIGKMQINGEYELREILVGKDFKSLYSNYSRSYDLYH